ncbi:MAG: hypothetical protein JF888_10185 [Candidatus Dormibacteraeota bacterium]|uniref:SHS2 domain-containing protein n=1 Tax=Candidatus Dormiibacter inghamiae TaxID=3127013 RepID=A0A934KK65_9BACT|nr:hypothetical protein [Candidatus Dormibacteraeota bacterium]MBJ7607493.1 hypothetical protein [Candidatus Dormibacteraeota bacterium]
MSPLFRQKHKPDYYQHFTVLDLGSEFVKVLILTRQGSDAMVLGVAKEPQAPASIENGAIIELDRVIEASNRALETAEDMAGVIPGLATVGLAGELVKGFSSSVAYPRERPDSRVKESELRNMLQLVQRRALHEAEHLLELERAYGNLEARLIQSNITRVRIDGYPVANPIGYEGRHMDLTVFNTFAPLMQVGAVETVARDLDLDLVSMVSQPYAVARACAGDDAWEEGGIFIDMGGATTNVALLREGTVEGTRMFNLGGQALTRRIAGEFGLSFQDAEARKLRHSEGVLSPAERQRISGLLTGDVEVMLQGLHLSLVEMARDELLPANLYISGGASLLPEMGRELVKPAWREGLSFVREPDVRRLGPADVRNVTDATGLLQSPQDVTPLSLANHFLHQGSEQDELMNSVMEGVVKGLRL